MHVIFTPEGIPGWFGPEPVAGSVQVAWSAEHTLLTCRFVDGEWVAREPTIPPEPTPEEIAAASDVAYQERLAAWEVEVNAAIDASEPWRAYKWGEITLTAYRPQAQAIRDSIPMPER